MTLIIFKNKIEPLEKVIFKTGLMNSMLLIPISVDEICMFVTYGLKQTEVSYCSLMLVAVFLAAATYYYGMVVSCFKTIHTLLNRLHTS